MCKIYLQGADGKYYGFDETVSWAYPKESEQKKIVDLYKQKKEYTDLKGEAREGTSLEKYFEKRISETTFEMIQRLDFFETDVLIGRSFFHNFYHLQFLQKSSSGSASAIHFEINPSLASDIKDSLQ